MQRGLDAEVAAKMQQQQVKEISDQQWHLSIVREVDAAGFYSHHLFGSRLTNLTVDRLRKQKSIMSLVTVPLKSRETGTYQRRIG